jgi:hypothetical protein
MKNKYKPFEFHVDANGCFICTSHAMDWDGYPLVKRKRKMIRISRLIFEECFGPIQEGYFIRHKCDNPNCINPEHLEQGTPFQNTLDMLERNRQAKGEKNGSAKLTENDVKDIRKLRVSGMLLKEISKRYGIGVSTVGQIVNRRLWKHVD